MNVRMYPITEGPSVPWEVMAPHDGQAKTNHGGQSLERLAQRGGLHAGEAWCVVSGIGYRDMPRDKSGWGALCEKWREFADRINLHYDELTRLREALSDCLDAMAHTYDATEWPADGTSRVEMTRAKYLPLITTPTPTPDPILASNDEPSTSPESKL